MDSLSHAVPTQRRPQYPAHAAHTPYKQTSKHALDFTYIQTHTAAATKQRRTQFSATLPEKHLHHKHAHSTRQRHRNRHTHTHTAS